jgi:hypothetical protein
VTPPADRDLVVTWALWVGCGLTVIGSLGVLLGGATGNRIAGLVPSFAVAAVALGANAWSWRRTGPWSAVLYVVAALAIVYGLLFVLSVPLRLQIEGSCQPAPAPCPLGFDRPLTSGENMGIYVAVIAGTLALLASFIAVEIRYLRRSSARARLESQPRPPAAEPAPRIWPAAAEPAPSVPPAAAEPAKELPPGHSATATQGDPEKSPSE